MRRPLVFHKETGGRGTLLRLSAKCSPKSGVAHVCASTGFRAVPTLESLPRISRDATTPSAADAGWVANRAIICSP